jgi:hypothetical protein
MPVNDSADVRGRPARPDKLGARGLGGMCFGFGRPSPLRLER